MLTVIQTNQLLLDPQIPTRTKVPLAAMQTGRRLDEIDLSVPWHRQTKAYQSHHAIPPVELPHLPIREASARFRPGTPSMLPCLLQNRLLDREIRQHPGQHVDAPTALLGQSQEGEEQPVEILSTVEDLEPLEVVDQAIGLLPVGEAMGPHLHLQGLVSLLPVQERCKVAIHTWHPEEEVDTKVSCYEDSLSSREPRLMLSHLIFTGGPPGASRDRGWGSRGRGRGGRDYDRGGYRGGYH